MKTRRASWQLFVSWLVLAELLADGCSAFDYRIRHETAARSFSRRNLASRRRIQAGQARRHGRPQASSDAAAASLASRNGADKLSAADISCQSKVSTQTVLPAAFGLMKAILGSGCLALPFGLAAMSDHPSSLVAANLLLLGLGILSAYTFSLYGRLAHATGAKSLGDIWKRIFTSTTSSSKKKDTSWIVSAANLVYCLGCCLTFSLVIGDSLSGLLKGSGLVSGGVWATRQASILGITTTVLLPLVQLPSLAALAPVSIIGVLGTMVIAAFMTLRCPAIVTSSPYAVSSAASSASKRLLLQTTPLSPLFQTYHRLQSPAPLVLVAMGCVAWMAHFSAPDFYHGFTVPNNDDQAESTTSSSDKSAALDKYNRMTILGYSLVAIVNAVILSTGFLTFGGNSMGMILNNYSPLDRGASLSRILVLVSMLGGFPFVFQGCLSSAMDLTRTVTTKDTGRSRTLSELDQRKRMTAILMSIITATSLVVEDAGFVVSFNGALMGTAIIYIFPALLFLKVTSSSSSSIKNTLVASSSKKWIRVERWFSKFLVVFGGVSAVLGAVTAVLNTYFPHLLR